MTQKVDNGGEAFPVSHMADHGAFGMSLRDYFAAKTLVVLLTANGHEMVYTEADVYAKLAYKMADAMIAEKRRTEK
jgi:hypothetical protein